MQVNGPEGYKLTRKKFLAVGAACTAIHGPVPGFKGRAFELWILNRWTFNFCVHSTPLRRMHMELGVELRQFTYTHSLKQVCA